jgi:hypothetical protein
MPWHQLNDALDQSERARNVVETEKAVKARETDVTSNRGMEENALQLRTEINVAILKGVVKGLDAHPVAGENETTFGSHPYRDRKHSTEPREARFTPAQEGVENDLGIAARFESISLDFQLGT